MNGRRQIGQAHAVQQAAVRLTAGGMVVLCDDMDSEGLGYLVLAGELAASSELSFMTRHSSGFVCVVLRDADADRLELPVLHHANQSASRLRYGISVDARDGVGTGISAADRAHTIALLSRADTQAGDLSRPGHVVTLRAVNGGVLENAGYPEAALELAALAGLESGAALAAIVSVEEPTRMASPSELAIFAEKYDLPLVSLSAVVEHQSRVGRQVSRAVSARVPMGGATFTAVGYRGHSDAREHVAFVLGQIDPEDEAIVHVHRECVLGDVFGSHRCTCHDELAAALAAVTEAGRGVVVYLRDGGTAGGLLRTLAGYRDAMFSTPVADPFGDTLAAQIIADLGIRRLQLLTSGRDEPDLESHGLEITARRPLGNAMSSLPA